MTFINKLLENAVGKPAAESGLTTRDGKPVRIYAITDDTDFPVHGAIAGEDPDSWKLDGSWRFANSDQDLIPAEVKPKPKTHTRTIWLCRAPTHLYMTWVAGSPEDEVIASVRVTWVEGEFAEDV